MTTFRCSTILVFITLVTAPLLAEGEVEDGFVSLFNGEDLTGWTVPEGDNGHWKVVDGVIDYDAQSEATGDRNLWTKQEYGDFIMKIDWRLKQTSGFYDVPIVLQDGSLATLPWHGISWAKPQIDLVTTGDTPQTVADVLAPGDIVYV
ncbi:MAG: DUF1080 domain-containing protein, partial [Fuerstiella sp.]|nr:DUF1080 domain-containing protein [Fuerstiella sp.]